MRHHPIVLILSFIICLSCACRKDKCHNTPIPDTSDGIFAYMAEDKDNGECIFLKCGTQDINISATWKINSISNPLLADNGESLYFEGRDGLYYSIFKYDITTGKIPVRITPDIKSDFTQAKLNHDGSTLLLNRDGQIVEFSLASRELTPLTFGSGQNEMPCESADGSKVYFIHKDMGKSSLMCMQRDNRSTRSIDTANKGQVSNPLCDITGILYYICDGQGLFSDGKLLLDGVQSANITMGKFVSYTYNGKGYIAEPWSGSAIKVLDNAIGGISYTPSHVNIAEPEDGGKIKGTDNITSDTDRPSLGGKMVYHNYTSYDAMDSRMYIYDFGRDELTEISKGWTVVRHPMNGHFSPDGKYITFMGIGTATESWDIFIYELGSDTQPVNITATGNWRDEDPKFSYSGEKICFKRDDRLCEYSIADKMIRMLSKNNTEPYSMPYYTTDDSKLLVGAGLDPNSYIGLWDIASSGITKLYDKPGTVEYYPVTIDDKSFYYTQHISPTDNHDQLYKGYFDGSASDRLPFNRNDANYSDACPVSDEWLILVSTKSDGMGGYDLYIANEKSGAIFPLTDYNSHINTSRNELGADYIPAR